MTWHSAKAAAETRGMRLAYAKEALDTADGNYKFGIKSGDHWLPVLDGENQWIEIGDSNGRHGWSHNAQLQGSPKGGNYGDPAWGITAEPYPHKGYVCYVGTMPTAPYQELHVDSGGMTWHSAKAEAERHGLRLAYAKEALVNGKYRFGVKSGDHWLPVMDGENE